MEYSKILKQIREKLFLTQQELGDRLDVSFSSINRWETGKNQPSLKCRKRIVEMANTIQIEVKRI